MGQYNEKLTYKIITVKELLQTENLTIPNYQRPYKWKEKNVNQLIDDIIFHKEKSAYRLGTLVIHSEKVDEKEILNIVDGQQRTITLTLIAYAIIQNSKDKLEKIYGQNETIDNYKPKLLNLKFTNDISKANIQNNYRLIEKRINEFDEKTIKFFYEKCELVEVILSDITEAFQFFDSQNARGKDLEPHDLLKAFHLREMNNFSTEEERIKIVEKWESIETEKLSELFSLYLFRIRNWSRGYSAKYFTKNDIDLFKGINLNVVEDYPYTKIYRIVHYYIDEFNNSYHRNIDKKQIEYPFQLDQPIINGKRFFEMIYHYYEMINEITNNEDNEILKMIKTYKGSHRTGDKYTRNLFYCGLIYFIDRFGEKEIETAINKIFVWAYTLRLKLYSVRLVSIDNYALNLNKNHSKIQLFKKIREALHPSEIRNLKLEVLQENKLGRRIDEVIDKFKKLKYIT